MFPVPHSTPREIKASRENPYLYRAVLRTLHRPLSVLVNNLSANLLPLLSSPDFSSPVTPSQHLWQPNATQLHALGYANLAGELLDTFDLVGLGLESDMRGDGLKVVRDGLVSVVKRVVDPLVTGIKKDLMPHIEALEFNNSTSSSPYGSPAKTPGATKLAQLQQHASIIYLQGSMPAYARALSRFITTPTAESSLATLLISLVWRGLVALSSRPFPPASPPTSPALLPPSLSRGATKDAKKSSMSLNGSHAHVAGTPITPPTTPPASRFTLKLPPPSRPVSPNGGSLGVASASADARALYDLLLMLPRPKGEGENSKRQLAKEVVDEAFEALAALPALLQTAQSAYYLGGHGQVQRGRPGYGGVPVPVREGEMENDLDVLTADVPTLIALPIILRAYVWHHLPPILPLPLSTSSNSNAPQGPGPATIPERTVSSMLGLSEAAYRNGCLSGFGREEECTAAVGQRVLDVLKQELRNAKVDWMTPEGTAKEVGVVLRWLEKQVAVAEVHH